KIEGFPIAYTPVRYPFFGVESTVSSVGYNITKALKTLGHDVTLHAMIGDDSAGELVRQALQQDGLDSAKVLPRLRATPQSVILYDGSGKRMINVDLKDLQETSYPLEQCNFSGVELAVLTNINFSRPMLEQAKAAGVPIATDVHVIRNLEDEYNSDYMAAADILFMSDEGLPVSPEDWVRQLWERYQTSIVVIGLGAEGALLGVRADQHMERIPAKALRPIVNTIGAGDALFSSFLHGYIRTGNPYMAIRKAVLFAGYKIGEKGAAQGFMTANQLEATYREVYPEGSA
ncbi:MAG: carbohydrate kinase family protein, partial [Anaerolineae bacterium]|nr:carbohydrate kinase family protein [Anaerolineae bacterium]